MRFALLSLIFSLFSCGIGRDGRDGRDGVSCTPTRNGEAISFRCSDGFEFDVEGGKIGPKGDRGQDGIDGKDGENGLDGVDGKNGVSLLVLEKTECKGLIAGPLANTAYDILVTRYVFETEDVYLKSLIKLTRDVETLGILKSSNYVMLGEEEILRDGTFTIHLVPESKVAKLTSGSTEIEINCEVK